MYPLTISFFLFFFLVLHVTGQVASIQCQSSGEVSLARTDGV